MKYLQVYESFTDLSNRWQLLQKSTHDLTAELQDEVRTKVHYLLGDLDRGIKIPKNAAFRFTDYSDELGAVHFMVTELFKDGASVEVVCYCVDSEEDEAMVLADLDQARLLNLLKYLESLGTREEFRARLEGGEMGFYVKEAWENPYTECKRLLSYIYQRVANDEDVPGEWDACSSEENGQVYISLLWFWDAVAVEEFKVVTQIEFESLLENEDLPAAEQFARAHIYITTDEDSYDLEGLGESTLRALIPHLRQEMGNPTEAEINSFLEGGEMGFFTKET